MAIRYNTRANCSHIFRATNGGTVFSANLATTGDFDYFTDIAQVNDAIYFSSANNYTAISDVLLNVGTAMVGTGIEIVWEYQSTAAGNWRPINLTEDETEGFTKLGARAVRFPVQPNMCYPTAGINGVSNKVFVRARINALTLITEGGANTTDRVKAGNGVLYIGTEFTDANPCTFADLVDWINTNRPDLDASKVGSLVKIDRISGITTYKDSPLRSTNEVIFYGCGAFNPASLNPNGLWFGTKVGEDGYKNSSILNICCKSPGNKVTGTATNSTRVYGGQINTFSNLVDGITCTNSGPLGMQYGEWIGVRQDQSGYFVDGKDMNKCIVDGGLIISSTVRNFPRNLQIANPGNQIFTSYSRAQNIKELNYSMPTTAIVGQASNYGEGGDFKFIDCTPVLPSQKDDVKVFKRTLGTLLAITKFFKYSDGVFIDYTTEATNTTEDDVPLDGEVGDVFYIGMPTGSSTKDVALNFDINNQVNDYEYKMEFWSTNTWKESPFITRFDSTENFTKSGRVYCMTLGNERENPHSKTTVNGVNAYWTRFTITKKGTATPKLSRVRYLEQNGIMQEAFIEQYSYDMTVLDTDNNPSDETNIRITDIDGEEILLGLTDLKGTIPTQILTKKQVVFDAKASDDDYNYKDKMKTPHTITIRKYGFEESIGSKAISGKSSDEYKLRTNPYIVASEIDASAITGISITDNTILINENRTMQEVYDYTQYWATTKLHKDQPYKTTDGQTYYSTYDLILDGCELTGTGKINMIVNTVTYLNGATSEVDIIAADGTHTNIKLTNIVDGSRVQLYDEDDEVELFNGIVGTSLVFPVVWTTDKNIRIRVAHVDGEKAKEWVETTATLEANGLSFRVQQEDDKVYNDIAIDGSTVSECSIVGSVLRIDIDDPDNTTSVQRIYAFEVAWLYTEDGIRDQNLYIEAIDSTHFVFTGGLKIKNLKTTPLKLVGGFVTPETGDAVDVFDLTGGAIFANNPNVVGFKYRSNPPQAPILIAKIMGGRDE